MRSPLIEISIPGLRQQSLQYPVREVATEKGSFSITEKPTRAVFTLKDPQAIYTYRFAANVASYLAQGKYVQIQCGKNKFLVQELTKGTTLSSIEQAYSDLDKTSGKKIITHNEYQRKDGIFSYLQRREISVIFRTITDKSSTPKDNPTDSFETDPQSYVDEPPDDLAAEIDAFLNDSSETVQPWWENSVVCNVGNSVANRLHEVAAFIDNYEIVNIPTTIFNGSHDKEGIFIGKDFITDEIIINLNGNQNNAQLYQGVIKPLISHFLHRGDTVAIDYNQSQLDNRDTAFTFFDILESVPLADIRTDLRESHNGNSELPHNYVILEPKTITLE
ncbi:MAG: hypothetical protein HYR97_04650 [Candidatus Melainabacteria bacterium]|nr:hypothetical protein [Candidatus Melainabacteria bacterium]